MIGTSTAEYVFIRICIILLRAVTPLSILYWLARFLHPGALHVPVILDVWTAAEVAFYVLFYIPRKRHLQKAAIHPPPPTLQQRRELFSRCSANIPDYERYLRGWFMGAPLSEIKRENLREFLSWAFLNTADLHAMSGDEFDEYIHDAEEQLGRKIESGKGSAKCLRLTLDRVIMSHRCLIWYLVRTPLVVLKCGTRSYLAGCLCRRYNSIRPSVLLWVRLPSNSSPALVLRTPPSPAQSSRKIDFAIKNNYVLAPTTHIKDEAPNPLSSWHWYWSISIRGLLV